MDFVLGFIIGYAIALLVRLIDCIMGLNDGVMMID